MTSTRVFLLRAYGDFAIALNAITNSKDISKIEIIASKHLQPLFNSISEKINLSGLNIQFVDFGINSSLLNLFTNKNFLKFNTINQLVKIKKYLNRSTEAIDFIEQKNKLGLFQILLSHNFKYILEGHNIYKEWDLFLNNNIGNQITKKLNSGNKILILPDARLMKRNIPEIFLNQIVRSLKNENFKVNIAFFNKKSTTNFHYTNFNDLVSLIEAADFVIGCDSLPIHLCALFKKPHFILYPKNGKKNFFTPFALEKKYYCTFNQTFPKLLS
jgi:ADP-heptose:LPS heptosyltransferase